MGSVLLCSALLKTKKKDMKVFFTEQILIRSRISAEGIYSEVGKILYGDSIKTYLNSMKK
jgi:hypothetical protein